ncbi:S8 family peptidase [Lewinella sp. 4G2]|uniref:S8 family peptidase n=1 Tax=Lewinella sp. 4G2 TaxID=1803372 RepID=UPI0007B4A159|nr:S8 family peptidase [Lewinella sp. 4G2]OAV42865.1 hypothetical protein A3850_016690 [Lewinella sp. 4G2]
MFKHFLTPLLLFCCLASLSAQRIDHVPGQLIVQLGADVDARKWMKDYPGPGTPRRLGRTTPILVIDFDHDAVGEKNLLRELYADSKVRLVQYNHPVTFRRQPNDLRYDDQWSFNNTGQLNGPLGADINVEPAWDVTTGGVTENGDTIVVAVIDDGADLDHEDLVANLWRNRAEIPDNGIDDDGNGYVDDIFGFDTANNDGNPETNSNHGTPVAGIIGARGNNGLGVAGINWETKLMIIRNDFFASEVEVIQAYSYVLDQRRLYKTSNGTKGAYVVVTNASWGRNYGDPADSPIWCSLYDELGEAGILNTGAVANLEIDVERDGDLPTRCTSDYLIGVTSLNTNGQKPTGRGFGATSVDLGAHAEQVLTTESGNGYGRFGGTSSATPHVAGAAALLYAAPCAAFAELLEADPAAAALYVRQILLETTAANSSLAGRTSTGGQLDVGAAMARLMSDCDACFAPTGFSVTPQAGSATALEVNYNAIASIDATELRYREVGASDWIDLGSPALPLQIDDLGTCVAYEFELRASCGGTDLPVQTLTASTDGCCVIPADFSVAAGNNLTFRATWTPNLAGEFYRVRYRQAGTENWLTRSSRNDNVIIAGGILPCTAYEFEFRTDCDTARTEFGAGLTVLSLGCGACLEESYCRPNAIDNAADWIEAVNLANLEIVVSGAQQGAYGDFTGADEVTWHRGGTYPVTLTPGTTDPRAQEVFRVYVDWNQDGIFSGSEASDNVTSNGGEAVIVDLTVPDDAELLSTRMRVLMSFLRLQGTACSNIQAGEYEDYCITVAPADSDCSAPKGLELAYDLVEDVTLLSWKASSAAGNDYQLRYRPTFGGVNWTTLDITGIETTVEGLDLCGSYDIELASLCDGTAGDFRAFTFANNCTDTEEPGLGDGDWSVFPNPAYDRVNLRTVTSLRSDRVRIYGVSGRLFVDRRPSVSDISLDVSQLPAGLYLVELTTADGRRGVKKLLKR